MEKKSWEQNVYESTAQFTVNDIRKLIEAEIDAAGLLFMPVFAGMIALGHLLYGHEITNREAFLKFARYRMALDAPMVEILYDNVYGGLIKQWSAESHIILVACISSFDSPANETLRLPSFGRENTITINALNLAGLYISAVGKLPKYSEKKIHQFPEQDEAFDPYREQIARYLSTMGE